MITPGSAAERRLRLAFVGCGAIAEWHLTALRGAARRTEVTAAIDVDLDRAAAMSKETGAEPFGSMDDAVASGTFDAALIMVPHRLHEELAVAALRAGKHVLLEKPLAPTLDVRRTASWPRPDRRPRCSWWPRTPSTGPRSS